jgi:hypothetical protein
MRLTATSESISFLGAGVGCIRPRPLSPLFGGSSLLIPIAAVGVVGAVAGFEGAGVAGAVVFAVGAGVAGAISAAVSSTFAASAASVSALAWAIASWQEIVASQCPRLTSLAVWLTQAAVSVVFDQSCFGASCTGERGGSSGAVDRRGSRLC